MNAELKKIQSMINKYREENPNESVKDLSDTYHTFGDLYKHRTLLTALAFIHIPYAWKSKVHEDGTMFDGMFIVGCPTPYGMITYHYNLEYWDLFKIPSLPHAPHFDGHTPEDVLDRMEKFILSTNNRLVNFQNIDAIEKIVRDYILPTFEDDIISASAFIAFFNK